MFYKCPAQISDAMLHMLLYKRISVPRTKENLLSGDGSLQITMTGRHILPVVNKLCQKHIQRNSNMLMLHMQCDISEQIHVWTQNQHWGMQSYLSVIFVIYWPKMFYWKATY